MFCFFWRWRVDLAEDRQSAPGPHTAAHLRGCPRCRQYHAVQATLVRELSGAAADPSPPSLLLQERIVHAIRQSAPTADRPAPSWLPPLPGVLRWAAGVALLILGIGGILYTGRRLPAATPVGAAVHQSIPLPAGFIPSVALILALDSTTPEGLTCWVETPMHREMHNLSSDVQSGLQFLTACLPVLPLESRSSNL